MPFSDHSIHNSLPSHGRTGSTLGQRIVAATFVAIGVPLLAVVAIASFSVVAVLLVVAMLISLIWLSVRQWRGIAPRNDGRENVRVIRTPRN